MKLRKTITRNKRTFDSLLTSHRSRSGRNGAVAPATDHAFLSVEDVKRIEPGLSSAESARDEDAPGNVKHGKAQ